MLQRAVYVKKILSLSDAERVIELFKGYCEKNMVLEPEACNLNEFKLI